MLPFHVPLTDEQNLALLERVDKAARQLGEWATKCGEAPERSYGLAGRLVGSESGWGLLTVPNAIGQGAFDALHEVGAELPTHNGRYNAHISVFRPKELESIGGIDKIQERGHAFHYTLGPLKSVKPAGWPEMSKVWFIEVKSPELEKLRKSYGLPALPDGDKPFHITVAVRKVGVTQANDVTKSSAVKQAMNDFYANGDHHWYCSACEQGFSTVHDPHCPRCGKDCVDSNRHLGRRELQRRGLKKIAELIEKEAHSHFRATCVKCKTVFQQCRCNGEKKELKGLCSECSGRKKGDGSWGDGSVIFGKKAADAKCPHCGCADTLCTNYSFGEHLCNECDREFKVETKEARLICVDDLPKGPFKVCAGCGSPNRDDDHCVDCGSSETKWIGGEKKAADRPFTVAIDLDGTILEDGGKKPPEFSPVRPKVKALIKKWREKGWRILVFTVRGDNDATAKYLNENGVEYDYINYNPDQPQGASGKLIADLYVDDRAINANRDWDEIEKDVDKAYGLYKSAARNPWWRSQQLSASAA